MKKLISILLTLSLVFTMAAASVVSVSASTEDVPEFIRVGIKSISQGTTFSLASADGFKIYSYNAGGSCSEVKDLSSYTAVNVTAGPSDITVKDIEGNTLYSYANTGTEFVGCADISGGIFTDSDTAFRGGLMLFKSQDYYKYINVINTEKYLYVVLPKEMSGGYPQEALKAQAVAARSYVAGNIDKKHKAHGYDLCNTTDCQVYGGVACEVPSCTAAVVDTEGIIVYYDGAPADTCVYGSSNGGYIEACRDIWSADLGYLQGKEDPYDPQTSWTIKLTRDELQNMVDTAGYGIGILMGVNIIEKTPGGSVLKLEFVGTEGSKVLTKSSISTFFGTSKMKSLHFDITASEFSGFSTLNTMKNLKTTVSAADQALPGFFVMDVSGSLSQIDLGSPLYLMSTGLFLLPVSGTVSSGGASDVDGIELTGKGYGHCLGMSQTGAREMAKQGFPYDEILKFYYTGVEVR